MPYWNRTTLNPLGESQLRHSLIMNNENFKAVLKHPIKYWNLKSLEPTHFRIIRINICF